MRGQPPCGEATPVACAESDRSGETVAAAAEVVKVDFQNVNTTLMKPATSAFTRPLKLS